MLVGVEPDKAPVPSAAMDSPSSSSATFAGASIGRGPWWGFQLPPPSLPRRRQQLGGRGPARWRSYASTPIRSDDAFDSCGNMYLLAKTYFNYREYRRAAHVLQTHKAVFLRCYALYMVGKWRKGGSMGAAAKGQVDVILIHFVVEGRNRGLKGTERDAKDVIHAKLKEMQRMLSMLLQVLAEIEA